MNINWGQIEFNYASENRLSHQDYAKNMNFLYSIRKNDVENFFRHLENGVNINFISNGLETPLMIAMENNNLDLFSLLLDFHANANQEIDGYSLIWYAIWEGKNDFINLLVKKTSKNTKEHKTGKTILMEAVLYSNFEAVQSIVLSGFNVNAKDNKGNTALHYALNKDMYSQDDKEIIKFLINAGADVLAKNSNGNTPSNMIKDNTTVELEQNHNNQYNQNNNYTNKPKNNRSYNAPRPKFK